MEAHYQSPISSLLEKLDKTPGFAGLGASIQLISRLGDDDETDARDISVAILRDAALTARLLHVANSSRYARGSRNISTIDQVLAILGMRTVKSIALSLALLESLPNKAQSKQLHAEVVVANFCGGLAYEITHHNGTHFSAQEAQVCGLMQNLGRIMSIFYLYEDIERSQIIQAKRNLSENDAVLQTLGVSFEEIGTAIARHWSLPDVLQKCLAPDSGDTAIHVATDALAWSRQCSTFCRRVAEILFRLPENREKIEIANVIDVFQKSLRLNEKDTLAWIERCLFDADILLAEMAFPCNVEQARNLLRKGSERAFDMLSSQDALVKGGAMSDGQTPVELIKHALRLIHAHYDFDRTLICLPMGPSGMIAIAGVGKNAAMITTKFRSSGKSLDIFRLIMDRCADTFIPDVRSPAYAKLVPNWYGEVVGARSFVMLPLQGEGKLLGMVYGDYQEPHDSAPPELAAGQMQGWRNQIIRALLTGIKRIHEII